MKVTLIQLKFRMGQMPLKCLAKIATVRCAPEKKNTMPEKWLGRS